MDDMSIENKFIDFKFLDEESVEKSKEILINTFAIDINNVLPEIRELTIKDELDFNINEWINKVHPYILKLMNHYNVELYKIFKRSSDLPNRFIDEYLIRNLKLNILLYYTNKNKKNNRISQIEAVKKYINTETDKKLKAYYLENDRSERLREYSRIITINKKKLKDMKYQKLIDIFIDNNSSKKRNKECYGIISNIFIEMMQNISKIGYTNTMTIANMKRKKRLRYRRDIAIKRAKDFFDKNLDIEENFLWERINNTFFIEELYFNVINIQEQFKERQDLFEYLFPVIYLPNVFDNGRVIGVLNCIYRNDNNVYYKYKDEFENGVKELCLNLAFLVIPLYNKIFSVVISEMSKCFDMKLEEFLQSSKELYKNPMDLFYYRFNNYRFNEEEYLNLSSNVYERFNIDILDLNKLIGLIGNFNEEFLKIMEGNSNYKKTLKEFLLKIIFLNEI